MSEERRAANFIEEFIDEDLASGRYDHVRTRFPPSRTAFCTSVTPRPCA